MTPFHKSAPNPTRLEAAIEKYFEAVNTGLSLIEVNAKCGLRAVAEWSKAPPC